MNYESSFSNENSINQIGGYKHSLGYLSINTSNFTTTQSTILENECDISKVGSAENVAYALFMSFILLTSLAGNGLVVAASLLSRHLRNKVTTYLIVSLAISDLSYSACSVPYLISHKLHGTFCYGLSACYWWIFSDSFFNVASILNLFLIAMDRFIAIKFPFRYSFVLTLKRAKILIIGVWSFSAVWSVAGIFQWKQNPSYPGILSVHKNYETGVCSNINYYYYAASFLGIYLVPLVVMTVTYLSILSIALVQISAIESTQVKLGLRRGSSLSPEQRQRQITNDIERNRKARQRKRRKELKATKSVAMVYFAFLLCWFPLLVINIIILFNSSYFPKMFQENEKFFNFIYYTFIQILPTVNTMVNPVIYSFSNKKFQAGFKSVFNKAFRKTESPQSIMEINKQRKSRTSQVNPLSPTTSCSSQSCQSVGGTVEFSWLPTNEEKWENPNSLDNKGAYLNSAMDGGSSLSSTVMMWKPD